MTNRACQSGRRALFVWLHVPTTVQNCESHAQRRSQTDRGRSCLACIKVACAAILRSLCNSCSLLTGKQGSTYAISAFYGLVHFGIETAGCSRPAAVQEPSRQVPPLRSARLICGKCERCYASFTESCPAVSSSLYSLPIPKQPFARLRAELQGPWVLRTLA